MPLSLVAILGDAVWIVAMAMIASATRAAWRRLAADARVPLSWRRDGTVGGRAGKSLALALVVGPPLVFGLALSAAARDQRLAADGQLIVLLLRCATAPLFILAHMLWLRAASRALAAEGALKP